MNKMELRRKVLMAPLGLGTLLPLVVGATLAILAWAINLPVGLTWFISLLLCISSVGIYFTRLLMGMDKTIEDAVQEEKQKAAEARERELDQLYYQLSRDGDDRTQKLLSDLRKLTGMILDNKPDSDSVKSFDTFDIMSDVHRLFNACVGYLKQSLELLNTANGVAIDKVKKKLMGRREEMILQVQESVKQLEEILAGVKTIGIGGDANSDLAELRKELDRRLEVAQRVEDKMRSWEQNGNISSEEEARYLREAG